MRRVEIINNRNKIGTILLSLGLLILVIGFSYVFFIYNKTGLYIHTITGGKMKVIYDEVTGNNITSVFEMVAMFYYCENLTELDVSK